MSWVPSVVIFNGKFIDGYIFECFRCKEQVEELLWMSKWVCQKCWYENTNYRYIADTDAFGTDTVPADEFDWFEYAKATRLSPRHSINDYLRGDDPDEIKIDGNEYMG